MSVKYKKAPISELICGVIFNAPLLSEVIYKLIVALEPEYPRVQNLPPILEEEFQDGKMVINMNPLLVGNSVFRLFSKDESCLIQLQHNFILFNWRRLDEEDVGNYPGFDEIYNRFKKVYELAQSLVEIKSEHIKSFTLHYLDRIFWNDYINNLSEIDKVLSSPPLKLHSIENERTMINNISSRYIMQVSDLNGHTFVSLNTSETYSRIPILSLECKIKGLLPEMDNWFNLAHNLQLRFFENTFNPNILKSWQ